MRRSGSGGVGLWRGVAFVFGVLCLLWCVALLTPDEPVEVGCVKVHFPSAGSVVEAAAGDALSVDDRLAAASTSLDVGADSSSSALADSVAALERAFAAGVASLRFPGGDFAYLFPVFEAMRSAADAEVGVIHFGDSQIEGDRITHVVRDSLQALFGGAGPGVVPLWQPIPTRTVEQTLSDSVATFYAAGIMGRRAAHDRYGAAAQLSELRGGEVRLAVAARQAKARKFRRVTAYVGTSADTLRVTVGGLCQAVPPSRRLRALRWDVEGCRKVSMTLEGAGDVYGIGVGGAGGVSVTNVPLRGSDGLFFSRMNQALFRDMAREMNTRLIIMEFGGNALPMLDDSAGVRRYAAAIGGQIERVKSLCPDARIIFVGPADMSVKANGNLQTHPLLPALTKALASTCDEHGVAFWDMYAVMGGWNSMAAWVSHSPPLAGPDYIHFTMRGANKIAGVLWRAIRASYDYMLMRRRLDAEEAGA